MNGNEFQATISVIVPVFNGEEYLYEALASLLQQTKVDFEAIIVDDGSSDSSHLIAKQFVDTDPRFKLIRHGVNKGGAEAMNTGIMNSQTDYITQLSADDFFGPSYLEGIFTAIRDSQAELLYSDYFLVDEFGNTFKTSNVESVECLSCGMVLGVSRIYKKELFFRIGGFDPNTFMFEDYEFMVRAWKSNAKMRRFGLLPFFYRNHNNQLTNTKELPNGYFDFRFELVKDEVLKSFSSIKGRAVVSFLHSCVSNRRWKLSISLLKLGFRECPVDVLVYGAKRLYQRVAKFGKFVTIRRHSIEKNQLS